MQHDYILLDRSASMSTNGKWPETLSALNGYVAKIAEEKVDTGVTLIAFDKIGSEMSFDMLRDKIIPSTWNPVSDVDAMPRGYTPLNDAVVRLVSRVEQDHVKVKFDKVVIVIITDGEENSSKEASHGDAKRRLDDCRAKGWQVIFLGVDFENSVQAESYGNKSAFNASVDSNTMRFAGAALAESRTNYSTGATQDMAFTDEQREKMKEKKA